MSMTSLTHSAPAIPEHRLIAAETANQWTHGAGLALAIVGAAAIAVRVPSIADGWRAAGSLIYAATLVALYAASTLSHSFLFKPNERHFWRMMDQVCIFFLIAGTYTPFGLTYLREGWTSYITLAVWSFAIAGAIFKARFSYLRTVGSTSYVLLGWLPMMGSREIVARVPHAALMWIVVGGLLYTAGTLFLANDHRHKYFHAVWHVMVVTASICHFMAIYCYVL